MTNDAEFRINKMMNLKRQEVCALQQQYLATGNRLAEVNAYIHGLEAALEIIKGEAPTEKV